MLTLLLFFSFLFPTAIAHPSAKQRVTPFEDLYIPPQPQGYTNWQHYDGVYASVYYTPKDRATALHLSQLASQALPEIAQVLGVSTGGHVEVVKTLLAQDANVDTSSNNGSTALMCAAGNGHAEVVKALLAQDADVNLQENDGWTALMIAAAMEDGYIDTVKVLIKEGANLDIKSNDGWTALMMAAAMEHGHTGALDLLIQLGDSVDIRDNHGNTALMSAGHIKSADLLISAGANVMAAFQWLRDNNQQTAITILCDRGERYL